MTNKRITIKDIADKAGVSIGSVHCAIAGKPGVGEETRLRILNLAKQYGYRPNSAAAALKRKTVRIAAVFPGPSEDNRYYFTSLWEGIRDYLRTVRDFNIEMVEVPYYRKLNNQAEELRELMSQRRIDGIVTVGHADAESQAALARVVAGGVAVVLIATDIPDSGRLCCVLPNYDAIGRGMAELLTRGLPPGTEILMCAGDLLPPNHLVALGFDAFLRDRGLEFPVRKIYADAVSPEACNRIVRELRSEAIGACCAVNARSSVMLGRALRETGRAGMPAIGSDIFSENIQCLHDGVFTYLLHKNPYSQSYLAAKCLVDHLLRDLEPQNDTLHIGHDVVLQSSLPMYGAGRQSLHIFNG